jgi:TolA-binding protein
MQAIIAMGREATYRAGRRVRGLACAAALLAGLAGAQNPPAGGGAVPATIREMRESAFRSFGQGDFSAAIAPLEGLIAARGSSKETQARMEMEPIFYNLALCYFLTANFASAEKAFQNYITAYPHGGRTSDAYVYVADCRRYTSKYKEAVKGYEEALRRYTFGPDLLADIYAAIASCHLAEDNWTAAREPLLRAFHAAPDGLRRNRAATLLATAYLKTLALEKIYPMVPYLLQRDSLASRSIAFNMAALEAGDQLFQEERYREAFWIYRLVYPHDEVLVRTQTFLDFLQAQVEYEKREMTEPRRLMRLQQWLGETEAEIKALGEIDNYDYDLEYRLARGYMEALRYREAREVFLHLHQVGGKEKAEEKEKSQEALYLAFACSARLLPWTRAYETGRQYMETYPDGRWYDELTLMMGQMLAKEQNWAEVLKHFGTVLHVRPNHQAAAECLFLVGYASFMLEQFEPAAAKFVEVRTRFPQSELIPAAVYWTAMAELFNGKYDEAGKDFDLLLSRHGDCPYAEDAAFRRAMCAYGSAQYDDADRRLTAFVRAYPRNKQADEATMMRGDIAGAQGRIADAVKLYQQAMEGPNLNIELYNHCAFQGAQILFEAGRFQEVRQHLERYIDRSRDENRAGSNVPLAVYWIGRALLQLGEQGDALRYYRETVANHGRNRRMIGIDMIMDEWIAITKKSAPATARAEWQRLQDELRGAAAANDPVMTLRLKRVLMFHPEIKPGEKERLLASILQPENITNASPAVLEMMLTGARERQQGKLAAAVAREIVDVFTETDYALDARMALAEYDMELAAKEEDPDRKKRLYEDAIRHLGVVRTVYASKGEAAQAMLILGRLYREQGRVKEAEECFRDVLAVREWKQLWPEALYGSGECSLAQREYIKASAYYERIYLLYSHYNQWAARAYLRRAEALHLGYQDSQAIETIQAMLKVPDLAKFPEFEQAKVMLAKLENK